MISDSDDDGCRAIMRTCFASGESFARLSRESRDNSQIAKLTPAREVGINFPPSPGSWYQSEKSFQTNGFSSWKGKRKAIFHRVDTILRARSLHHENLLDNIIKPNNSNLSHQSRIFPTR